MELAVGAFDAGRGNKVARFDISDVLLDEVGDGNIVGQRDGHGLALVSLMTRPRRAGRDKPWPKSSRHWPAVGRDRPSDRAAACGLRSGDAVWRIPRADPSRPKGPPGR